MIIKSTCFTVLLLCSLVKSLAQERHGAALSWTTYEAERMRTNGTVLGPAYDPYRVETESSGQACVKLGGKGQFVEFSATGNANGMIIRYSLPDDKTGNGTNAMLAIVKNGRLIRKDKIDSHYAWLYGKYPFTNNPDSAKPRHFYDELRLRDLLVRKGDVLRIQLEGGHETNAAYCIIDLVDLEEVAPTLKAPANSLWLTDKRFTGSYPTGDYTKALRDCIARAVETGKTVWIPAGTFKITGDIVLPANITVQGAGMWYTELEGDEQLYPDAHRRVRLIGNGSHIHMADFAIVGALNYRNDREANDGITGSFGENSTISRIWVEHTKVGMWIENSSNLKITGCRMRNTMADGINFCVGMAHSTIDNCTARGTGDDCFAIWPAAFKTQEFLPGYNEVVHCTGQLPFLANGAAIYGGDSNVIRDCSFVDISQGSAILISTTFPTEDENKGVHNNFSGKTLIQDCTIKNSGGFDHDWGWRAAVEICLDKRSISGLEFNNVTIENSLSNGFSIVAKNTDGKIGWLRDATLQNVKIAASGIAGGATHALYITAGAHGSLTIKGTTIADSRNESANFTIVR